ncbi:hypothetical protein F5890DRAFT_384281 [Lentinula detonsa]|uniref:Uncharacterized protein n=1 Tax=Lentinula detonsa TaxID=2804962 RepID=A0AA38Q730_9AGAR|nr:hypothetical protein F5890DRAFT_384281 [Lentinula detonsa]
MGLSFTNVLTLCIGLFVVAHAVPVSMTTGNAATKLSQVSPRRVAQRPSFFQDSLPSESNHDLSNNYPSPQSEIQLPLNQTSTRFQLIFLPLPGGNIDDPTTSEHTKRITSIVRRYLNQSGHYHGLSRDDFTLVNGWDGDAHGTGAAVVEFRIEDSARNGHCNSFCLGMVDVPYDTEDSTESIHGTLAQDQFQLFFDHAQSRISSTLLAT